MNSRTRIVAALAVAFSFVLGSAAIAPAEDVIARFDGVTQGNAGGHAVEMIGVTPMGGSKAVTIPVPNEDPKKPGATPRKELDDAIKKFTPGQVVKLSVEKVNSVPMLAMIEAYQSKPGEDTPNGYVFSKTFPGKKDGTIGNVILTKFGAEHTFTVAMRKGENGQEQDPDVVATLAKLNEGDPVWVQTQGKSVIAAIEPYKPPLTGKVTKVADADVDGHKIKSAEITTDDGKTVTVLVPGKESGKAFIPDALVANQLAKARVGSQVEFRVREDGDKTWLREIQVQKPTAKKPTPAAKP